MSERILTVCFIHLLVFTVLGTEPRIRCMLGKHCTELPRQRLSHWLKPSAVRIRVRKEDKDDGITGSKAAASQSVGRVSQRRAREMVQWGSVGRSARRSCRVPQFAS